MTERKINHEHLGEEYYLTIRLQVRITTLNYLFVIYIYSNCENVYPILITTIYNKSRSNLFKMCDYNVVQHNQFKRCSLSFLFQ